MGKNGLLKRTLSATLAAVLAMTLVPAGALTFAQEALAAQETSSSANSASASSDAMVSSAATEMAVSEEAVENGGAATNESDAVSAAISQVPDDMLGGIEQNGTLGDESTDSEQIELAAPDELLIDESVRSVNVPATVRTVSPIYFWQFPSAESIVVEDGSETFASHKGMLYTADMKTLVAAPLGIGAEVELAPTCESIAAGALRGVSGIEHIRVNSIVSNIFVSAGDTSQDATGYAEADLAEVELSAFSVQTTQDAIVAIDVDPAEAIEAAFAWSAAGFQNVQMPEAAVEEGAADGAESADEVVDDQPDGVDMEGAEADQGADGMVTDGAAALDAPTDSADETPTDPAMTPATPVQILNEEKLLKDTDPAPNARPQMITGEYSVLDTTKDDNPESEITSDDVLSYETSIDAMQQASTANETTESSSRESAEEEAAETIPDTIVNTEQPIVAEAEDEATNEEDAGSAAIAPQAENLRVFSTLTVYASNSNTPIGGSSGNHGDGLLDVDDTDRGDFELSSPTMPAKMTTWLNANGGTITSYYMNDGKGTGGTQGNTSYWNVDCAIPVSIATRPEIYKFDHRGGAAVGVNTYGSGYFHTTRMGEDYNANYEGCRKYGDNWLYRYNVKCTRTGYEMTGWTQEKTAAAGGAVYEGPSSGTEGMTLYANWTPRTYTVTFYDYYANNGSTVQDYKDYYTNNNLTPLTANAVFDGATPPIKPPTRVGYAFQGFFSGPNGQGTQYYNADGTACAPTYTTANNIELYAAWAPVNYTITFNPNGGLLDDGTGALTGGTLQKNYTVEQSVAFYANPTREGYFFAGWMIAGLESSFDVVMGDGTQAPYVENAPVTFSGLNAGTRGNLTLTALWGSTITVSDIDLRSAAYSPTRHWYYYPGYGYSATGYAGFEIYLKRNNMILNTDLSSALVNPPSNVLGFTFQGYFSQPDADFTPESPNKGALRLTVNGTLASSEPPAGSATWYAQWRATRYTATFDPNGGILTDENGATTAGTLTKSYVAGNSFTFYDAPTREGYFFAGWVITGLESNLDVVYGDEARFPYVPGAPVAFGGLDAGTRGNVTLTAYWGSTVTVSSISPPSTDYSTLAQYSFYPGYGYSAVRYYGFDVHRYQDSFITKDNYATKAMVNAPDAIGGFVFKGYYTAPNADFYTEGAPRGDLRLTTEGKLASFVEAAGNVTWYAQWEAIGYTVTLDPAGGAFSDGSTAAKAVGYKRGAATPLVGPSNSTAQTGYTPTRNGWYFVGWHATNCPATVTSTRVTGGIPYSTTYLSTSDYGDITFTAVWRAQIALNKNAPQYPKATTVTFGTSSIYYYTGYGFSFGKYTGGASQFGTQDVFYQKGDAMFAATATFAPPVCDDEGWIYGGFKNDGSGGATSPIGETGVLAAESVEGDTSWSVNWIPRTYYATLRAYPGIQSAPTRVAFLYGDTKLRGYESLVQLPIPTFNGWTFTGYYLDGRCYYEGGAAGSAAEGYLVAIGHVSVPLLGDCTLTAKWVRDIAVNANGGVSAPQRTIQVTYGMQLPGQLTMAGDEAVLPSSPQASPRGVTWTLAGMYGDNTPTATRYYDGSGARQFNAIISGTAPETIYARWQRTVTVDANGGAGAASISITKGITTSPQVDAGVFAWEGYTLAGFYQNADPNNRGTKYFNSDGSPTNICRDTSVPVTVYAQWDADTSIIAFDANGGTGGPANITGVTARAVPDRTMPVAQPVRPNFYFAGWFTEREGGDLVEQLPAAFPAGGVTYYAHWTAKPPSVITYKAEEGGAIQLAGATEKVASFTQEGVLPDTGSALETSAVPDMGYAFAGWFTDDGTLVSSQQSGWAPTRPAKGWPASTTYHARFEQAGSQIAYRCAACGAELVRSDVPACEHIHSIAALPAGFQLSDVAVKPLTIGGPVMPPYYRFTGWSGTGLAGDANETITIDADHLGDKVFTAHVEATPFTLTLDAAGGTWGNLGALGSYAVNGQRASRTYSVADSGFQLPVPQRDGYVFDHWERDGQPVSGTFTPGPSNYGDITLTAVWEAASVRAYRIEYILDDAQGPDAGWIEPGDAVNNYGEDDDVMLPIPQRVGYDFAGWTEESALPAEQLVLHGNTPQMMAFIAAGHTGDRIFRAHWLAHEYTIEYDLDGGAWEDPQPSAHQTCIYDKDVTVAQAPVRATYMFEGWARDGASGAAARLDAGQVLPRANLIAKTGSAAADDGTPTNVGTVVLRAVWTPVLSFDVGVAASGVHMGLTLNANDALNPFGTNKAENWGEAVIQNRTDAALKVKTVSPNPAADYASLEANALKVFRDQQSLDQASFKIKPAEGPLVLLTIPEFKLADSTAAPWNLEDTGVLGYPIGWMMKKAGDEAGGDKITLNYQLDMGNLTPADVDFSTTTSLQVASVRFSVALVNEEGEA